MNLRTSIFSLCVCVILLSSCGKNKPQFRGGYKENNGPIELEVTKEEDSASAKWKDKSMNDLILDVHRHDKGALYILGLCFLVGRGGLAIDVESADYYFAQSASFGFAPALDQMRITYINERNPFLALVYQNLIISEGHSEFLNLYHEARNKILNNPTFGPKIVQEIERIAIRKKALIQRNNDVLKKRSKGNGNKPLDCKIENITEEDLVFDEGYWQNIVRGITPRDTEFFRLMVDRNAEKAEAHQKRLEAYKGNQRQPKKSRLNV